MAKLFRVETKDNKGVYQTLHYERIHSSIGISQSHPSPWNDGKLLSNLSQCERGLLSYQFGFSSARQMRQWFKKEDFENIHAQSIKNNLSFFVSVYSGPVVEGEKQAIAILSECHLMGRIPIEKFIAPKKRKKSLTRLKSFL